MCSLDGYGKYHLFGCDHEIRIRMLKSLGYDIEQALENCGGYIP